MTKALSYTTFCEREANPIENSQNGHTYSPLWDDIASGHVELGQSRCGHHVSQLVIVINIEYCVGIDRCRWDSAEQITLSLRWPSTVTLFFVA